MNILLQFKLSEESYVTLKVPLTKTVNDLIKSVAINLGIKVDGLIYAFLNSSFSISNNFESGHKDETLSNLNLELDDRIVLILKEDFVYNLECLVLDFDEEELEDSKLVAKKGDLFFVINYSDDLVLYSPKIIVKKVLENKINSEIFVLLTKYFISFVSFYQIIEFEEALNLIDFYEELEIRNYTNELELIKHSISKFVVGKASFFGYNSEILVLTNSYFINNEKDFCELYKKQLNKKYFVLEKEILQKYEMPFYFEMNKATISFIQYLNTTLNLDISTINSVMIDIINSIQEKNDYLEAISLISSEANKIVDNKSEFQQMYLSLYSNVRLQEHRGYTLNEMVNLFNYETNLTDDILLACNTIENSSIPNELKSLLLDKVRGNFNE